MPPILDDALTHLLDHARAQGRDVLLEHESLALAGALGLGVPVHRLVRDADEAAGVELDAFPGARLVVKVASPRILHKSDAGGVRFVAKERAAVAGAVEDMARRFSGDDVAGFLLCEHVEHDAALGGELLLGLRWTDDFGPVVVLGPGGVDAEHLAAHLRPASATAVLSPVFAERIAEALEPKMITRLVTEGGRGGTPRLELPRLLELLARCLAVAVELFPEPLRELEINPLALTPRGPVALDALVRLGHGAPATIPPRPLAKLERLLRPRTVAIAGVSRRRNPGRIIVENLLAEGFPRQQIVIVKPDAETIAGCRSVPSVVALPGRMDLVVLAIDAEQSVDALADLIAMDKAESVILIPGGLGERHGSEERAGRLRALIDDARRRPGGGPVVNGGNCLGVRSVPGRCDTMFIPRHKLRYAAREPAPLALLSQSGALAVARASALEELNPRYLVSLGNQIDLTVGDYLTYLQDDPDVEVFACYVEGFRPGDGRRFLEAAAAITASGRTVILYRAGRTAAGARASATHTASIAGDPVVTRELAGAAGVVTAATLADFDDLTRLFCRLRGRPLAGRRLAALSNAGFECVAVADSLGGFELAELSWSTRMRLAELLRGYRLEGVVDVGNPLDVTPIADDEGFAEAAHLLLADDGVDAGVIGCVPLTGSLQTLAPGEDHDEDVGGAGGVAERLGRLWRAVDKPWVAVVDAGPRYEPLVYQLEACGVPVFRTIDRAVRLLDVYRSHLLRDGATARGDVR